MLTMTGSSYQNEKDPLRAELNKRYASRTKKSRVMFQAASKIMPGGLSHNARYFEPYPFFVSRAKAQHIWDIDGNRYTDYWMGHTALIFGHSPDVVISEIRRQISNGLLLGTANRYAFELAKMVTEIVPCAESIRFCTTGAEATMYAVRLARAYTKRSHIVKMGGGWHGYNSSLTYGVSEPFGGAESAGLIPEEQERVKLAPFNQVKETTRLLSDSANHIACVIIEPVLGGGVFPASREYLQSLRKACDETGALLIFDEVITGFRLSLGGAQEYYKVKPDLCTLGKILGGGLPASAVAGRRDIMSLADTTIARPKEERAWIGGGTFSEHALSMRAGLATIRHLRENRKSIYPSLLRRGEDIRKSLNSEFGKRGIKSVTTGAGSLFGTHFLAEGQEKVTTPTEHVQSNRQAEILYCESLMTDHDIFLLPGHISAISTSHTDSDLQALVRAGASFAELLEKSR